MLHVDHLDTIGRNGTCAAGGNGRNRYQSCGPESTLMPLADGDPKIREQRARCIGLVEGCWVTDEKF